MESLERLKNRLQAVTSGKGKMERLLAADPKSPKAAVWQTRLAEYETSMAGLPGRIKAAEDKVTKQSPPAKAKG